MPVARELAMYGNSRGSHVITLAVESNQRVVRDRTGREREVEGRESKG